MAMNTSKRSIDDRGRDTTRRGTPRPEQKLALSLLSMLPSAHVNRVGVRIVSFRGSMATPPILYLHFVVPLAVPAQDSRPSGSVSGRRRRADALASVRRSNCTYTFRVCSFHEDSIVPRCQRRN